MLQVGQEAAGVAVEQLQDEARALEGPEVADALLRKIVDNGGVPGADGDDDVIHQHNAQRNGGVDIAAALTLHIGDVHDDEGLPLVRVMLDTGGFLLVQGRGQVGGIQGKAGVQPVDFFLGGVFQVHPAAFFKGGAFGHVIVYGFENPLHAVISPFRQDGPETAPWGDYARSKQAGATAERRFQAVLL